MPPSASIAHAHGVEVSVDNTFLSPALQSPLALGADIVMHSTTKYLNGHSDGLGGALIGSKPEHKERFLLVQKAAGGVMSPFECFLVLRGIKTLPLRIKQHEENGRAVAEFLSTHPKVSKLAYPGLKSHPQYDLAVKQQKGFGSMMSFELKSREEAARFLAAIKIFFNAESLGGVESLASHSATTTHGSVSEESAPGDGHQRGPHPPFGRHRGQGRPDRRPGSGAEGGVRRRHAGIAADSRDRHLRPFRVGGAGAARSGLVEILGQTELAGRTYSATLVAAVAELLRQAGTQLGQLSAIVAVNGPGSFTGVRVGLSAVKGPGRGGADSGCGRLAA